MVAYELACATKALERRQKGKPLTITESDRADRIIDVKNKINSILAEHGISDLNSEWNDENWKKFGQLIELRAEAQNLQKKINYPNRESEIL